MTDVAFHSGLDDKLAYACRLLRKASRQGQKVVVTGEPALLSRLDLQLWTFEPGDFVAHARLRAGESAAPALCEHTPIWLADLPAEAPAATVLVNLGPAEAPGFQAFERLIELVGPDDEERLAARSRWRQYQSAGHPVSHHQRGA